MMVLAKAGDVRDGRTETPNQRLSREFVPELETKRRNRERQRFDFAAHVVGEVDSTPQSLTAAKRNSMGWTHDGLVTLGSFLASVPVLETPPASMEQREIERRLLREAHEEVDASNKAIEEAKKRADSLCDTTADNDWTRGKKWGASFVAMALDPSRYQTDDLGAPVEPVPAPEIEIVSTEYSVGQTMKMTSPYREVLRQVPAPRLEWNFYPDNGYYWTTRAPWEIHVARDANSYGERKRGILAWHGFVLCRMRVTRRREVTR